MVHSMQKGSLGREATDVKIVVGCVQISGRAHATKAGVLLASMAAVAALVLVAQVTSVPLPLSLSACVLAHG